MFSSLISFLGLFIALATCQQCQFDGYHACLKTALEPKQGDNKGPRPQPKDGENPLEKCLKE